MKGETTDNIPGSYNSIENLRTEKLRFTVSKKLERDQPCVTKLTQSDSSRLKKLLNLSYSSLFAKLDTFLDTFCIFCLLFRTVITSQNDILCKPIFPLGIS